MTVYSYYYGASAGSGIGIQAQSRELENLPLRSDLKDLSSLHALESSEHSNEMLSYLLARDGYSVLGLSYIESPKSSGYSRSAPCGLQYVTPGADLAGAAVELGKIVNFVNFQKPASAAPAALSRFPMNESGYYYHNRPALLEALVDGLARAALSGSDVLLIALPKGKSSEYATARYTIAEALGYLPVSVRLNIRFFTGLPVAEGVTDPLIGLDNAIKFGANVVFCPNEYYKRLMSYRACIGVDMDNPSGQPGAFAEYITHVPDVSAGLSRINPYLSGAVTYDTLNDAAQQAKRGNTVTVEMLQGRLNRSEAKCRDLEQQIANQSRDWRQRFAVQEQEFDRLQREYRQLVSQRDSSRQPVERPPETERGTTSRKPLWIVLAVICALVLMALTAVGTALILPRLNQEAASPSGIEETATPVIADEHEATAPDEATEEPTAAPAEEITSTPETIATPELTDALTEEPTEDAQPAAADNIVTGQLINRYGMVTVINNGVNLRSANNSVDSQIIRTLPNKTYVWMIQADNNDAGENWTKVIHQGTEGYIRSDYLEPLSQEESDLYNSAQPSPVPVITGDE